MKRSTFWALAMAVVMAAGCGGNSKYDWCEGPDCDGQTDTEPDVLVDVTTDTEPDVPEDGVEDPQPDAEMDVVEDTELDAPTDAETEPEAVCGNGVPEEGEECDGGPDCDEECHLIDDADGDTISDEDEDSGSSTDTDMDSTPDYQDEDADADTIPDSVEAGDDALNTRPVDSDGDTVADFRDLDSDDDGLTDEEEAGTDPSDPVDTDGDTLPDYLDEDSDDDGLDDVVEALAGTDPTDTDTDGDTISDGEEGIRDTDTDGTSNPLDEDSDGDGVTDAVEAGDDDLDTPPVDTDLDGTPDYLDRDSDQDGLPDESEVVCGTGEDGRLTADTDGDSYSDLVEVAVGSDPCDPSSGVYDFVEFFFILPYLDPEQNDTLQFEPSVIMADVFFNMDTTGSMGGEIHNLQAGLGDIMADTRVVVPDAAFGVGAFRDFPCDTYGSAGDYPFQLVQPPTTSSALASTAVGSLYHGGGYDAPESGYEALFQIAEGSGISGGICWNHPPFTAVGRIGGAQFRPGALPIVLHITDALSHESTDYPSSYHAHPGSEALIWLQRLGARVITVQSGTASDTTAQLQEISEVTGAVVPVCAFEGSCGAGMCCGGTIADGGDCILRYTIDSDGTGLTSASVDGIAGLVKYTTFDVYAQATDDGDSGTPDTSLFLTRIEANTPDDTFLPPAEPERSCCPVPTPAMFNATTYDDGFNGYAACKSDAVTEGAKLFFTVVARNTHVPATDTPQVFVSYIQIVDELTSSLMDVQEVVIIVPPVPL